MKATCSSCGHHNDGVRLCERLDPVNWHPHRKKLCEKCRKNSGYTPVGFRTSYVEAARPW